MIRGCHHQDEIAESNGKEPNVSEFMSFKFSVFDFNQGLFSSAKGVSLSTHHQPP